MTFLPIVVRELRIAARRRTTYRARFWTAFAAIGLSAYFIWTSELAGRIGGVMVFSALAFVCFLSGITLAGSTVDCISEEKREGTLGLLFLTDLRGHDIALGKLVSTSLNSFYALIGVLPAFAISFLMGGVHVLAFIQVALALLNAFFFFHALGILVSTFSRNQKTGAGAAIALSFGCTLGFLMLSKGLQQGELEFLSWLFALLNPGYCVFIATKSVVMSRMGGFQSGSVYWISLLLIHLSAWLFLGIASWWLPRCWQEKGVKQKVLRRARSDRRSGQRTALLDLNPYLWFLGRQRADVFLIWTFLIIVNGIWGWLFFKLADPDARIALFVTILISNHIILKMFVAGAAAQNFEKQRQNGVLEHLLSCTPLTVREILRGQCLAVRRQFLWPAVAIVILDIILMIGGCRNQPGTDSTDKWTYVCFVLTTLILLPADMIALTWVGMWNGISRKPRHAVGTTVGQVLLLPWAITLLVEFAIALHSRHGADSRIIVWTIMGGLLVTSIPVDIFGWILARRLLLENFRALAAPRTGMELGLFGRIGRYLGRMVATRVAPRLNY